MQNENLTNISDTNEISNEIIFRSYLFRKENLLWLFDELKIHEYIILMLIQNNDNRIYMKLLADKMLLTPRSLSHAIRDMNDRGLLLWNHDGDGSEGTYIDMTPDGKRLLDKEQANLKKRFEKVISKFGKDNIVLFAKMLRGYEEIMHEEIAEKSDE